MNRQILSRDAVEVGRLSNGPTSTQEGLLQSRQRRLSSLIGKAQDVHVMIEDTADRLLGSPEANSTKCRDDREKDTAGTLSEVDASLDSLDHTLAMMEEQARRLAEL